MIFSNFMNKNKSLTIEKTFTLAVKNHQEGKTDIAIELYNQVLEINPKNSAAHNNLGGIFKKLKENEKAKDCFEKAIEIKPNLANAHYNLGNMFQEFGENEKAKDCFEKAIEFDPLNKRYMVAYGYALLILNDRLKGYEYIDKVKGVIKFTPTYYKII